MLGQVTPTDEHAETHRASYTLELGVWHARCRMCDHRVEDKDRRRAAAAFRHHIQEAASLPLRSVATIDLRRIDAGVHPKV